jgi:hypothetical protein
LVRTRTRQFCDHRQAVIDAFAEAALEQRTLIGLSRRLHALLHVGAAEAVQIPTPAPESIKRATTFSVESAALCKSTRVDALRPPASIRRNGRTVGLHEVEPGLQACGQFLAARQAVTGKLTERTVDAPTEPL